MAEPVKTRKCSALSGWPMIIGWLGMIIFALHASTHMVGAGDTWVALACGRHFINHGVSTAEPFSANSHPAGPTEEEIKTWPDWVQKIAGKFSIETVKYWHPTGWINQNWLTHVIFYWLTTLSPFADAGSFSFNTLVYWKFAIYIITVACVYYTGRLLGANPALSAIFACFAMFEGRSFLDIRPAGFSNLLVAVFMIIIVLTTYRNVLYIWLIVPLAVLWCNLHGGYIYIFIMLIPFTALNFLTSVSRKRFVSIGLKGVYHSIAAGLIAFLAMIVFNPFHLTNLTHTFLISLSKHAEMWRSVNEWHPAFEWSNDVGTGFPFLVLFVLGIGTFVLWLFSRILRPRLLKAPKNELVAQKRAFTIQSTIFGCGAAILVSWVAFIGFSFLDLDAASFLVCALFVGIVLLSIYKNVYFIYLAVLLSLLGMWLGDPRAGYAGIYIYPFVLLPWYVIIHIIVSLLSKDVKIKTKDIAFVAVSAAVSLLLMVLIFNPFRFTTPLWDVRGVMKQFLAMSRIWHPVYEGKESLNYSYLFPVLYIMNVVSVIIWLIIPYLKNFVGWLSGKTGEAGEPEVYQPPKIDLTLTAIGALTIYMAVCSRRFIPIAGIVAGPIIAMFIDQTVRTISVARSFHIQVSAGNKPVLVVPSMSYSMRLFFILAGAAAVLAFGVWWGLEFKSVYLDPWPMDEKLNSVFMRMTASHIKPFYACQFIRMNKLRGKMFNYWTEGGFIAWGQDPDPNGKTPLQLFMDGRAQAAYEPDVYQDWASIIAGGSLADEITRNAQARRRNITAAEYREIGKWISDRLKERNVWVVLMPLNESTDILVRGLEHNADWLIAFMDNDQKLFVNITTPQGQKLFDGIFKGGTLYPDEFYRDLVCAHNMLLFGRGNSGEKEGFEYALKAFSSKPSRAPMNEILSAAAIYPELIPDVNNFCKKYFDDFSKNKSIYIRRNGGFDKFIAAFMAADYLRGVAAAQKNTELVQFYDVWKRECEVYLERLREKRW